MRSKTNQHTANSVHRLNRLVHYIRLEHRAEQPSTEPMLLGRRRKSEGKAAVWRKVYQLMSRSRGVVELDVGDGSQLLAHLFQHDDTLQ